MWRKLVGVSELHLEHTLLNGQCFGWSQTRSGNWVGVVGRWVVELRENGNFVEYKATGLPRERERGGGHKKCLEDYFQLETSMKPLCDQWMAADPRLASVVKHLPGIRILRDNKSNFHLSSKLEDAAPHMSQSTQLRYNDPVECLFSFICSSNNNISRISSMLLRLRAKYGTKIGRVGGEDYYMFPSVENFACATESELRALGLGYRAKFVLSTARNLQRRGGRRYLMRLRALDRQEAQQSLCEFAGVGPKVADCVALFSLNQRDSIPVDTHVWQIACRDMDRDGALKASRSLTPKVYQLVGDRCRERYGDFAGWAHSILFAAELARFSSKLPAQMREEMLEFKTRQKRLAAEKKKTKRKIE